MKRILLPFLLLIAHCSFAQSNIDTLAIQDFELVPQTPTWTFTGPVIYNSGFSSAAAAPPNSPIGIGGSRAWETTTNSGGLVLDFANIAVPAIYDSVRVHFNLAAMNLSGASGGPDDLDYVLIAYSTDGGTTYTNRMRIRGAVANNSFWAYSATGVAKVYYTPLAETVFQPTTTGLQTTLGYSNCEIVFPGSVTQVRMRITGRSSSSTDTWLVDNLLITGENNCIPTTGAISPTACSSYTGPSGDTWTTSGTYLDTIPNSTGCDSIITVNLTINPATSSSTSVASCNSYTSPSGNYVWTSTGTYADTLVNAQGCDSLITVNLSIFNSTTGTLTATACGAYLSPSGQQNWVSSGIYQDTIPNAAGCDSIVTANITILQSSTVSLQDTGCITYIGANGGTYNASGAYVITIPNAVGCDSMILLTLHIINPNIGVTQSAATLTANATGATYQWVDCNNGNSPILGATNQSFTPSISGNYAVIVTENGCADTSSCMSFTVVGREEPSLSNISISPNPAQGSIMIHATREFEASGFTICDLSGKIILHGTLSGASTQLSIDELAAGVYFLRITSGEGHVVRFTKQD